MHGNVRNGSELVLDQMNLKKKKKRVHLGTSSNDSWNTKYSLFRELILKNKFQETFYSNFIE